MQAKIPGTCGKIRCPPDKVKSRLIGGGER